MSRAPHTPLTRTGQDGGKALVVRVAIVFGFVLPLTPA